MENKAISEINGIYELEIPKIIRNIKRQRAHKVLLQFPDGMKPYAGVIASEVEEKGGCECFIWFGDCFGGCDVPNVDFVDLIVQFGHSGWDFKSPQ